MPAPAPGVCKKANKKYHSAALKVIYFFWRLKVKSINVNEKSTSTHIAAVTEFVFVTFMKNCLKRLKKQKNKTS